MKKIIQKLGKKVKVLVQKSLKSTYRYNLNYQKLTKILSIINSKHVHESCKNIELWKEPLNISELEIQKLIIKSTNYKVINPSQEKDIQFLSKLGIFWEHVKVNRQPIDKTGVVNLDIIQQDLLLPDPNIEIYKPCSGFAQELDKQEKNFQSSRFYHYSQKIALNEGFLYAICPNSGKVVASNCSFLVGFFVFYRFVGEQVFFILVGVERGKASMYFPEYEILIPLDNENVLAYIQNINKLKLYLILFRKQVLEYINCNIKNTVVFIDSDPNGSQIGHYLLNVLSGVYPLKDVIKINAIKVISRKPQFFGKINLVFPEIAEKDIEVIEEKSDKRLFEKMLKANYFLLKMTSYCYVTEELATRVYTAAKSECSVDFLNHLEQVRDRHFPLIFITWRLHRRRWLSQIEGIINIINALAESYPNLGIVFDGYSRIASEEDYPELIQAIQKEKEAVQKVANSINPGVQIYNSIGCTVQESLLWASIIDFYFASGGGSGLIKALWINNKPGITHEPRKPKPSKSETLKLDEIESCYVGEYTSVLWRENSKMPLCIPKNFITDYPQSDWMTTDYDFDWRVAYKEMLRLISLLEQRQEKDFRNSDKINL